jgi:hypothetical protein
MVKFPASSFGFLSGCRFAPNRSAGSNTVTHVRSDHGWLACQRSKQPFAYEAKSRRVPRPSLKRFALERDLNRAGSRRNTAGNPSQPRLSDLPLERRSCGVFGKSKGGRTSGRRFGRLRSGMCSKLHSNGRRRRELICPAARGSCESYRASRRCAKRQPVSLYEPGNLFDTGSYNDKNPLAFWLRSTGRAAQVRRLDGSASYVG